MAIVRGLCTLAEARLSIFGGSEAQEPTTRDALIEDYISAATVVIEALPEVGPQFAESRTVTLSGGTACLILPFAFNTVTTLTIDGSASTDFTASPTAGLIYAGTNGAGWFSVGLHNITAVVTVGSSPVAPNVKMAARELVTHWWRQGQQGNRPSFADSSSDPAVAFGVPTRRLMELLENSGGVAGFA